MRRKKYQRDLEDEDPGGVRGEDEEEVVYSILEVEEVEIVEVKFSLNLT